LNVGLSSGLIGAEGYLKNTTFSPTNIADGKWVFNTDNSANPVVLEEVIERERPARLVLHVLVIIALLCNKESCAT
jgi:hypothetical protein